jgi:hypothetical protein
MADAPEHAAEPEATEEAPRQRFVLDEGDFDEVPVKYRRFYRHWRGRDDRLGPNEVLCPVCKVVIRSTRELRAGDRLYCMACMTRMRVRRAEGGGLEADCEY